nr:PREDICTED: FRAS1-related extracellular matrix protein 1-like [Paralichthys olivaceus]
MDHPAPELRQHKSSSSSCPDGWTHYRRRCYIISSSVATWASAERTCSLLFNSSLTSVRSRRDMTWLWKFSRKKPFWIGLPAGPRGWMWADGRSGSFSRPRGAPPNRSGGSDCMLVENPRSWISSSCSSEVQHPFICSSPAHTH